MLQNRPPSPPERQNPAPERREADAGREYPVARQGAFPPGWVTGGLPLLEHFAPQDYKPSTVSGGFFGHEEAIALRTKLDAAQATLAAQNQENARMQQEIENYRARMERVTEAYRTLYQRTTLMAQSMAAVQQQYLVMRQELAAKSQEANVGLANFSDAIAALGMLAGDEKLTRSAREAGQTFRHQTLKGMDDAMQSGVANANANFGGWQNGLPDLAEIINGDRAAPMRPEPRKAAPPMPTLYQAATEPPTTAQAPRSRAPAVPLRLARVNGLHPKVFVRSEPANGDNKLCVLSQGAVVAVFDGDNGRVPSPDKKITFAHIRFNWQDHGVTDGWISEKLIDAYSGSAQQANAPQTCEPPESAG